MITWSDSEDKQAQHQTLDVLRREHQRLSQVRDELLRDGLAPYADVQRLRRLCVVAWLLLFAAAICIVGGLK